MLLCTSLSYIFFCCSILVLVECFLFGLLYSFLGPLLILELNSFPLSCQVSFYISSLFLSCLSLVSIIVFPSLSFYRFSIVFFFLWFCPLVCQYCFSVILLSFSLLSFFRPISRVPRFICCFSHTLLNQFAFVFV